MTPSFLFHSFCVLDYSREYFSYISLFQISALCVVE